MTRKLFAKSSVIAAAVAMMVVTFAISAQAEYPTKPINLWIGSRPGGSVDTLSKVLAKPLERELGQPVIVSSKPGGGGGAVCAGLLKNQTPDGHTLCMIVNHNVTFRPQHQKVDYGFDDFKYVARLADFKFAILARKEAAYSNWKEFLTFAKAKGEVTFGLITPVQKLVADEIAKAEGFKFRAVPYKGGSKLLAALLGGHIDIGISGGRFFPHYDAGEVKVIAAAGSERIPGIDAPTLRELGYDKSIDMFNLLVAPAGVPDDVVKKIADAFATAVQDPDYKDLISKKMRMGTVFMGPAEVTDFLKKEQSAFKDLIQVLKGS